jgi:hypothetical protein
VRVGRIIEKLILQNYGVKMWTGIKWLRQCTVAGSCEDTNEHSLSINSAQFRNQPSVYQLFKDCSIS